MKKHAIIAVLLPALSIAGAPGGAAEWTLETLQDKTTYQNVTVLHQASADSISDEYGMKEVQPRLEFRCVPMSGSGIDVRIDWQRFISSFNTEITFEADNAEATTWTFGVDRSNKITQAKGEADKAAIMKYLGGSSSLAVTVTPYSEVAVTVSYTLDGFDARLAELQEACSS